ncbi:Purple acid phosphatase 17 [Hibiscus syriacus]|uniref:Purple acid phosphatase n=1 Tax=Hibiscus syriacus TaxID=106335 RepID=A0A6A3A1Z1_HIBSY|nr:Purple acid phosphatase 17 [Hibiscus syriacus]
MADHWFIILISMLCVAAAELERFELPAKGDGSLSFLVIGDWGRRGAFNQSQVAFQMGKIGEKLDIDFVVSTGDNFYDNGLSGPQDPVFEQSFTNIYTANSLQKRWFSGKLPFLLHILNWLTGHLLGNHDYRGDAEAQLSHLLRKIDSRWLCLRSFIVDAEHAEIIFVDTTPFVKSYFLDPEDHTYDWRGIHPSKHYVTNLLKDVERALRESRAKWKIVVGHHAIRSIGHHGDTPELATHLFPILKANGVDFYMNGHDHCLEHISDTESPIQFLTSGAGSKAWRGDVKRVNRKGLKFFYDGQGFLSVKLTPPDAEIVFYDVYGKILHTWNATKQFI